LGGEELLFGLNNNSPIPPTLIAAAILSIGGAAFAASKVDPEFTEWFSTSGAIVRVSVQMPS
jgi:hypothetical protein